MTLGAILEPAVVVVLLFGGAFFNRNRSYSIWSATSNRRQSWPSTTSSRNNSPDSVASSVDSVDTLLDLESATKGGLLSRDDQHDVLWQTRDIRIFGWKRTVTSPHNGRYRGYFLSRVLKKFPFLVEAWYWALIYWVYQLGRAFSAVTIVEGTVHVARKHALQLIHLEQSLGLFHELAIQQWFLKHPTLMHWINRIYSFIHIPGTILFLVLLYYYTTTTIHRFAGDQEYSHKRSRRSHHHSPSSPTSAPLTTHTTSHATPALYTARRRTMALCNLLAFTIFTAWPCMPPRLLSDPLYESPDAQEAKSYGFVDTVHGAEGESSVWTQNKFCNQYAAMPSLHFGYSLLIGLTVMTLPLASQKRRATGWTVGIRGVRIVLRLPSWQRAACLIGGFLYPFTILVAIVATANHFILDAVAGAVVCGVAWWGNGVLLNLLVVEDYFLRLVRIQKPVFGADGEE